MHLEPGLSYKASYAIFVLTFIRFNEKMGEVVSSHVSLCFEAAAARFVGAREDS
jgi:hypothetical protein